MTSSAVSIAEISREEILTDLQRSVLLTVLYADLFDAPLTLDDVRRRLVLRFSDRRSICRCIETLTDRYITISGPYVTWKGREHLVDLRRRRADASANLWPSARRYAAWLSRIPFVRMVAVSGSLAVDNADARSDVDLFCITETKRLWLSRLFIVALSKMTRLLPRIFPHYLCPNYILALDALEVKDQNLYTAHEVLQALPLCGAHVYGEFLRANRWTRTFLPHGDPPVVHELRRKRPVAAGIFEYAFGGRLGDWIDFAVFAAFRGFYRRRARRKGWPWHRLRNAYQRSRYTVPEEGYVPVVHRLFVQRIETRLGSACGDADVRRLFPDEGPLSQPCCYDWESQFRSDYGESSDGTAVPQAARRLDLSRIRSTPPPSITSA